MSEVVRPNDMIGPGRAKEVQEGKGSVASSEILRLLDKDKVSLGDINPLIHPPDLMNREAVDALKLTALSKIDKYRGLEPSSLDATVVFDPQSEEDGVRFYARFEVPKLSHKKMNLLERLVKETYGLAVRTRKDDKGNDLSTEIYPPIRSGPESRSRTGGWYMGQDMTPTTPLHMGLFVFKDFGIVDQKTFLNNNDSQTKYIVEVREAAQYQTDMVAFITQISSILGRGKLIPQGDLLYETYYDLMRLGLKKVDSSSVYGMEDQLEAIKKGLIIPLANPDLSKNIKEEPQSVLMVGVPGTGKTLTVEELLQEETGIFIVPIDPQELHKELKLEKEKQTLIPRIAEVARISNKPVVLHVDDIENMTDGEDSAHSTLLNLMAGIRESGFLLLASTNKPEKIDPALIQPQRFGILLHFGLQDEEARHEILNIHADLESVSKKIPLFSSPEVREMILRTVASHTEHFTPRYLAHIATLAKFSLTKRITKKEGKTSGLIEEVLADYSFTLDDWEQALINVSSMYDAQEMRSRDERLREFVDRNNKGHMGFNVGGNVRKIFPEEVSLKIASLEAGLEQDEVHEVKPTENDSTS